MTQENYESLAEIIDMVAKHIRGELPNPGPKVMNHWEYTLYVAANALREASRQREILVNFRKAFSTLMAAELKAVAFKAIAESSPNIPVVKKMSGWFPERRR